MTADEIVKALRENAEWCDANEYDVPLCMGDNQRAAADLIESLQAQLADYHHMSELVDGKMEENQRLRRINENLQEQISASHWRERAAAEDLKEALYNPLSIECEYCKYYGAETEEHIAESGGCHACENHGGFLACFEWRGPQEDGEGDNNA